MNRPHGAIALALLFSACASAPPPTENVALPGFSAPQPEAAPEPDVSPAIEPQVDPAPDPPTTPPPIASMGDRSTIEGTIEIGIQLLEQRRYEELIRELAPREFLADKSDEEIANAAEEFAEENAQLLLEVLLAIRHRRYEMSDDGSQATWDVSDIDDAPSETLTFELIDGKWYIED